MRFKVTRMLVPTTAVMADGRLEASFDVPEGAEVRVGRWNDSFFEVFVIERG